MLNSLFQVEKCQLSTERSAIPSQIKNPKDQLVKNVNVALTLPFNEEKAFKNDPHSKLGNQSLKDILQKAYRGKDDLSSPTKLSKLIKCNKQKTAARQRILDTFVKNSCTETKNDAELENNCIELSSAVTSVNKSPPDYDSYCEISNSDSTEILASEEIQIDEYQSRKKRSRTIEFSMELIKKDLRIKSKL